MTYFLAAMALPGGTIGQELNASRTDLALRPGVLPKFKFLKSTRPMIKKPTKYRDHRPLGRAPTGALSWATPRARE